MSGAEFDARGHVPSCHPGTRITILKTLHDWVDDNQRAHRMLWLHGPAGVGKSAIVQSLAEGLAEVSKLGATLFFSGPNGRDNPANVLPTIAYQLAVRIPLYKEYLRERMIEDPKLLEKDMVYQFDILIVKPFTNLSFAAGRETWAILLDGLDECNGEEAQTLIVTLISWFSHRSPTTPLVWLIASRPEAHLQLGFASYGIKGSFEEHDVPANSDDACRDVEKFLRAKFEEIRQKYKDLIPVGAPWPVEQDITKISSTSSGLFAFAKTVVRYIDDPHVCDPITQLATVVSVTGGLAPGSLSALHALYFAILEGIPKAMMPILKLLLHLHTIKGPLAILSGDGTSNSGDDEPLVFMATLFDLQQHTVYAVLRKLHSVIWVPPLEESGRQGIKFYHASFPDYLKTLSGDYQYNATDLTTKLWSVLFKVLHEGDSSCELCNLGTPCPILTVVAYRNAVSGGRPPVKFSWDTPLADGFLDGIWEHGIGFLTHALLPECPSERDHIQVPLTSSELQDVLEKIDFSALLFQRRHAILFPHRFNLFNWWTSNVSMSLRWFSTII